MASTASGRGRPAILDKAELGLGNGSNATIRLVGEGDTVQIELPKSWSLDSLQRSATKTGGRTKVTFTLDSESIATNGHATAVVAKDEEAAAPAPATPRKRAAKKAATPEQPASPAAKKTVRRTRKSAESVSSAA